MVAESPDSFWNGMMSSLKDKHSMYFNPVEYNSLETVLISDYIEKGYNLSKNDGDIWNLGL